MNKKRAAFLYSREWEVGGYPESCPFKTNRAGLVRETILNMDLLGGDDRIEVEPQTAIRSDIERFHYPEYLDAMQAAQEGELSHSAFSRGLGIPDCPVFPGMYEYAASTVGGSTTAARLLLDQKFDIAFNTAGGYHHAHAGRAAGFCYINDVAIAAMILAEAGKRVFFLDVDVHHSDGVQSAFYDRNDVMVVSMHESGRTLYPGTGFVNEIGVEEGKGYTVNLPLPVGTYDDAYLKVFNEIVIPLLEDYQPDAIMIELGMDTLAGDPLAHLSLTNNVHVEIIEKLLSFNKPFLATGGGGYNVDNTVRSWALAWSVMCGEKTEDLTPGMGGVMLESIEWLGGLRDRIFISDAGKRDSIDADINLLIEKSRSLVFPLQGLE